MKDTTSGFGPHNVGLGRPCHWANTKLDNQGYGQTHPGANDPTNRVGRLVFLHDLTLAVGLAVNDRCVVCVDEPGRATDL